MTADGDETWVFGYGSLMWRPGFAFLERRHARARGYHRALCILSYVHRGTPERPGLVLGLDRGGSCHGIAFRVAAETWEETLAYLRKREMISGVYQERLLKVSLDDGRRVGALAYVVNREHPQYAGDLGADELLRFVRQGVGQSGANPDYVRSTYEHLLEMGVVDPVLARVCRGLEEAGA